MSNAGLIVVFAGGRACHLGWPLDRGSIEIGRETELVRVPDDRVSRKHARVAYDGRAWTIEDLGSRNGTIVDGVRIGGIVRLERPPVIRVGDALLLATPDVFAHDPERVRHPDRPVIGAALARTWARIEAIAAAPSLHLVGESGAGLEDAARHFHACGPSRTGAFVHLRCAILRSSAEAILFAPGGFVDTALGGTLFLEEVGALAPSVQSRLAAIEDPSLRLCASSDRPLDRDARLVPRLAVRFVDRSLAMPSPTDRRDEIAWHVEHELASCDRDMRADAALVEACMLARWPGHVRQLRGELRSAASEARTRGSHVVQLCDLVRGRKTAALRASA